MRAGPPAGAAFGLPFAAGLSPPFLSALSPPLALAGALSGLASPLAAGAPPAAAAAGLSSLGAFSALGFLSVSAIDLGSRTLGYSDLLAVRLDLEADASRLAVLRI